jgi:hypothetical protein
LPTLKKKYPTPLLPIAVRGRNYCTKITFLPLNCGLDTSTNGLSHFYSFN